MSEGNVSLRRALGWRGDARPGGWAVAPRRSPAGHAAHVPAARNGLSCSADCCCSLATACGCVVLPATRHIPSWMPMWGVLEAGGFEEKARLSPGWGQLPRLPPVSVPSPALGCLCHFGKLFVCSAGSDCSPRVGRASPKQLSVWQSVARL